MCKRTAIAVCEQSELCGFYICFPPQAHGHTALHMAAGLHGNLHQEVILQLLLSKGADPSIRNLENDQPAHLLQSGLLGEQVITHIFTFFFLSFFAIDLIFQFTDINLSPNL